MSTETATVRPVTIRPVTEADVPVVVSLVRDVLSEFAFSFGEGSDTDTQVMGLPHSYTDGGGAFFAAESNGRIVGTAGVYPLAHDTFELRKMYVLGEARGQGLGPALFAACKEAVLSARGRRIVLDTAEPMTTAIRLYEQLGFVRDDTFCRGERCTRGYRLELDRIS